MLLHLHGSTQFSRAQVAFNEHLIFIFRSWRQFLSQLWSRCFIIHNRKEGSAYYHFLRLLYFISIRNVSPLASTKTLPLITPAQFSKAQLLNRIDLWSSGCESGRWHDASSRISGVAFARGRSDGGAATRGACGSLGPVGGGCIGRGGGVECGCGSPVSALRHSRGSFDGSCAGIAALSLQGLRSDVQRGDGNAVVGSSPQGALAIVRGFAVEGGEGEGFGSALRGCGDDSVSLAPPVSESPSRNMFCFCDFVILRMRSCTFPMKSHACAVAMVASKSLPGRRGRLGQASVRSTTHRRGNGLNPRMMSERFTTSILHCSLLSSAAWSFGPA